MKLNLTGGHALLSAGLALFGALSTTTTPAQTTAVKENASKGPKEQNNSLRETPDASGIVVGKVVDSQDAPVSGACVVLCDRATGVPLAPKTFHTMSDEMFAGRSPMEVATAITDESGRYLAVFASDSSPGWGASTAEIKPNKTIVTYVPIVAGWSDMRPIERRGLEPDVPVMPNAKDIAAGQDTVLEAAKQCLLKTATDTR